MKYSYRNSLPTKIIFNFVVTQIKTKKLIKIVETLLIKKKNTTFAA